MGSLFDIITGGIVASIGQLIFDGGRTQAQIDSAKAAAEGALAAWRQSILGALEDVETSAVDLRAARERVAIQGEARDAAANAALLARSQTRRPHRLSDSLSAETSCSRRANAEIGAKADLAGAFVRLTQALGGGWTPADYPALSDRETDQ